MRWWSWNHSMWRRLTVAAAAGRCRLGAQWAETGRWCPAAMAVAEAGVPSPSG
ncbi:hypothetical protein ACIHFD_58080 [Nonomuraea sp. NPDC051941]|uniref:hypothetical protein n=1 Tax=Nonomuraea sp. NPDC051941 TaxID=3364373 RepID=UPI0037C868BD